MPRAARGRATLLLSESGIAAGTVDRFDHGCGTVEPCTGTSNGMVNRPVASWLWLLWTAASADMMASRKIQTRAVKGFEAQRSILTIRGLVARTFRNKTPTKEEPDYYTQSTNSRRPFALSGQITGGADKALEFASSGTAGEKVSRTISSENSPVAATHGRCINRRHERPFAGDRCLSASRRSPWGRGGHDVFRDDERRRRVVCPFARLVVSPGAVARSPVGRVFVSASADPATFVP